MQWYTKTILTVSMVMPFGAFANDTTYAHDNSGIVFTQNNDIQMVSEKLFLSLDEVRVDYVFRNLTNESQAIEAAFPVPNSVQTCSDINEDLSPFPGQFITRVDDKIVNSYFDIRAILEGYDITDELVNGNYAPWWKTDCERYHQVVESPNILIDAGFVDEDGLPNWEVQTAYLWHANIEPNAEMKVSHVYVPSIYSSISGSSGDKEFCKDEDFLKTDAHAVSHKYVSYTLQTGANWAGPIENFHLTIDKGAADTIISTCVSGLENTSPTTFELKKTDFEPDFDIDILYLEAASIYLEAASE